MFCIEAGHDKSVWMVKKISFGTGTDRDTFRTTDQLLSLCNPQKIPEWEKNNFR